jgi:uncharacterized membrane protein
MHPGVNNNLTRGEKAADWLKHWFGTWTALFAVALVIAFWVGMQRTALHWDLYPYILLNLCLSCLAAVQGIILQISANRGDRISGQVALHTQANTDTLTDQSTTLLNLQREQMTLLACLEHVNEELNVIRRAVAPGAPNPSAGQDTGSNSEQ